MQYNTIYYIPHINKKIKKGNNPFLLDGGREIRPTKKGLPPRQVSSKRYIYNIIVSYCTSANKIIRMFYYFIERVETLEIS